MVDVRLRPAFGGVQVSMPQSYRILHVDDDPLMRDIVELSLGLDPAFMLLSFGSAQEALAAVTGWAPDLILCDVVMPEMDGPALLARLREIPETAKFPIIFMTARAKASELKQMTSLGAVAVITKPFVPAAFADTVRRHLHTIKLASAGYDFAQRLSADTAKLKTLREKMRGGSAAVPEDLQAFVHKLAGAAGVFEFQAVSATASALEDAVIDARAGRCAPEAVAARLDALLETIASSQAHEPARSPA